MAKGKDFYGKDIAEVIEQACRELGAGREDLDIEVLDTGSSGIFGLCKKKAHIRVRRKTTGPEAQPAAEGARVEPVEPEPREPETVEPETVEPAMVEPRPERRRSVRVSEPAVEAADRADDNAAGEVVSPLKEEPEEPPSAEALEQIRADLGRLLELMGFPSEVRVVFEDNTVHCTITGAHEEQIVGPEGRTLDSLQYLLRKMVSACVPDRIMLALDAGGFRERRAGELRERALELAEQVKADGKTQAIPALNPSERRVVHMALQEDKGVRSRSVGEGLFKKVLIYKPGKGRRPSSRKRRGGQGGRTSGD